MTKYFKVYLNTKEDGSPFEFDYDEECDNLTFLSRELAEEFCGIYKLDVNHIVETEDSYVVDFYRPKPDKSIFTGIYHHPTDKFTYLETQTPIEGDFTDVSICDAFSNPNHQVYFFYENTFRLISEPTHLATYIPTGITRMDFTVEASSEEDAKQIVRDYVKNNGMISNQAALDHINRYYK